MKTVLLSIAIYILALSWIIHKYMPKEDDLIEYEDTDDIFERAIEELDKNERT